MSAAAVLGTVLLALITLFTLLNGLPWEPKGASANVRTEIIRELDEIKRDVREIRDTLRAWR